MSSILGLIDDYDDCFEENKKAQISFGKSQTIEFDKGMDIPVKTSKILEKTRYLRV